MRNWTSGQRIGVIGGPGDRRDEDFVMLGKLASSIFECIIIKEDDDTRGRQRGSAADLITQGIMSANPDCLHEIVLDETEAINKALDLAPDDSLVVILPETVNRAIKLIKARGVIEEEIEPKLDSPTPQDKQVGEISSVLNSL